MDPVTVSYLLVKFAGGLATQAGARTANLVFDYINEVPAAGDDPTRYIAREVKERPDLGGLIMDAINGDALAFTFHAAKIVAQPEVLANYLGVTSATVLSQTNRCPVNGEFIWRPGDYYRPDGTKMWKLSFASMRRECPLLRGRCPHGHEWLVFPLVG
jgi:hypothetical protein